MPRRPNLVLVLVVTAASTVLLGTAPAYASHQSPASPAAPTAVAGDGQAAVSWVAPSSMFPITSYTVRAYSGGTALVSTTPVTGSPPVTSRTVTGLANGTAYTFTVAATSSGGTRAASPASVLTTPAGPPGAPTSVMATAGDAQASVSWTSPSANGSAVTSYAVRAYAGSTLVSTTPVTGAPPASSGTVTGLTNGTAYTFTVSATNLVGASSESSASALTTPVGPPGAPTSVATTAGDGTLGVSWQAPLSDGGLAVTAYSATLSPGGATCPWAAGALTCTVAGLANGTTYTATVRATNGAGLGAASSGVTGTPVATPEPPAPTAPAVEPTVEPTVEPAVEPTVEPAPAPVVPLAQPVATLSVALGLAVVPHAGTVPVTCTTDLGTLSGCAVSLFAVVRGGRVLVGTGAGQDVVQVTLTERGRRLVARTGGRGLVAVASVAVDGTTDLLTAETAVTVVARRVELRRTVRFGSERDAVGSAARTFLRIVRGDLAGVRRVTCVGHTDDRGPASWNADLASGRAHAVCAVLARGMDVRTTVRSRGEHDPVASNATRAGRAANRRVVVVLGY